MAEKKQPTELSSQVNSTGDFQYVSSHFQPMTDWIADRKGEKVADKEYIENIETRIAMYND